MSEKIDDAYTDDNGSYINSRSTKTMHYVDIDEKSMTVLSHVVPQEGGTYYYNQHCGGCAYYLVVVLENEVYFLERYYRESKNIPGLKRMVIRAKWISTQSYEKHWCIVYSRKSVYREEELEILAYGDASKPDQRSYVRTSSKVLREEEELLSSNPGNFLVWHKLSSYVEFSFIKLLISVPILVVFPQEFWLESDLN